MTKIIVRDEGVFWLGDPEFVGSIPTRTELQVQTPKSEPIKIDFTITEYSGTELFKVVDGVPVETPLMAYEDIQPGDEVFGWIGGIVSEDRTLVKASTYTFGSIAFDKDDRHCWVMDGVMCTKGLQSLTHVK